MPEPVAVQQHAAKSKADVALAECLQLLKGPTDERRFVGLLLVTKLLPAGDEDTIRAVYDSIGPQFISRLLLPLRQSQIGHGEQDRQKDVSACVLALAMLASSCRLADIAASEELVEKVPLFVKVVKNGGVSGLLKMPQASKQEQDWRGTDAEAVKDALECLLAVAAASSEGHTVCIESGALAAACLALQAKHSTFAEARDAIALHLLGTLLGRADRSTVLSEHAQELLVAVPAVASFMVLDVQTASAPSTADEGKQPASALAPPVPDMLDPAALQLEALYVLLLILSSPTPQLEGCLEESARGDARSGWPAKARSGIATLLRGRLAPAQRQTTLQLAASVLGLVGAEWLLAPSHNGMDLPEDFFQLLVEVVKVEALITLRDALSPTERIPLAHTSTPVQPSTSTAAQEEPSSSALAQVEEDSDDDTEGFPPMMPPLERPATLVDEHGNDIEPDTSATTSSVPEGQEKDVKRSPANGHTELAGERAARVLPAVFALAEGCVEALAADSQRAEALADVSSTEAEDTLAPVLSDRVAMRAMSSLQEAHEAILQFLEAARQGNVDASNPIILAAIRSLGRFLAEAPDAFGERMQRLLPFLLTVQQGQAVVFLLPALSQVIPQATEQSESTKSDSSWLAALLDKPVLEALVGYTSNTANEARMLWSEAMARASSAAWAALASAEVMLLPAVELLSALQSRAIQAGGGTEQMGMAAEVLLGVVPDLALWAQERSRASPPAALGTPPSGPTGIDCRLLLAAGGLVASALLAAVQQGESQQLQKNIGAGAALVSRAIDEGFVRLAVAKRKAVERAQEQLSATTISAGGHEPPHVPTGSMLDDWLEDIRDEWIYVVRTTTQLAKGIPGFAAEIKKLKPLWSDDGGVHAWADVASDLQDLRQAVAGRSSS